MKILIAGAGNVGRYLARILVEADHSVTLIDRDKVRVERAREESGAIVVHGDASEPSVLENAGIRGMDVVVAVTGEDEDNLVVSNMAKFEFEVGRVVARVKNALNSWLYEPDIGVDTVVSTPHTIAELIEEEVVTGEVVQLFELPHGEATVAEFTILSESPICGRRMTDVPWPLGCAPVALVRDAQLLRDSSDVTIQSQDQLLCLVDQQSIGPLRTLVDGAATHRGAEM